LIEDPAFSYDILNPDQETLPLFVENREFLVEDEGL
jgi:hypothetical protein